MTLDPIARALIVQALRNEAHRLRALADPSWGEVATAKAAAGMREKGRHMDELAERMDSEPRSPHTCPICSGTNVQRAPNQPGNPLQCRNCGLSFR